MIYEIVPSNRIIPVPWKNDKFQETIESLLRVADLIWLYRKISTQQKLLITRSTSNAYFKSILNHNDRRTNQ